MEKSTHAQADEVYSKALEAYEALMGALGDYAEQAKRIRKAHDETAEREYTLATEIRLESPDISQTALERALKDFHRTDEKLVTFRRVLHDAQGKQEAAHAIIEREKYRLRVLSARLNELGGMLAYEAATAPRPDPVEGDDADGS